MQYQVPQFTNVEDKIFGPLTLKQFVYIAGSAGIAFLLWRTLPFLVAAPLMLASGGAGLSLAFTKINNKPLIEIIEAAFMYTIHGKLYLWSANRKRAKAAATDTESATAFNNSVPTLSDNKINNLAWSLDINERLHTERQREVQ